MGVVTLEVTGCHQSLSSKAAVGNTTNSVLFFWMHGVISIYSRRAKDPKLGASVASLRWMFLLPADPSGTVVISFNKQVVSVCLTMMKVDALTLS